MKYTQADFIWRTVDDNFYVYIVGTCVHCSVTTELWWQAVPKMKAPQKLIDSTEHTSNCVLTKAASEARA